MIFSDYDNKILHKLESDINLNSNRIRLIVRHPGLITEVVFTEFINTKQRLIFIAPRINISILKNEVINIYFDERLLELWIKV